MWLEKYFAFLARRPDEEDHQSPGSCNEQPTHRMEKTKRTSSRNLAANCLQRCSTLQHRHPLGLASCYRSSAVATQH